MRQRVIAVQNNECGKPCDGLKEETRTSHHVKPECVTPIAVNCKWKKWEAWSECKTEASRSQTYRKREVAVYASNGGKPCEGEYGETEPCGLIRGPVNCIFDHWQEWTACSSTCGKGRHTKMRRVKTEAKDGGTTCEGPTLITQVCEDKPCANVDCVMGMWGPWSPCLHGKIQKTRKRKVAIPGMGKGTMCKETLVEIHACHPPITEPCVVSDWGEWEDCDKDCGGGQTYRARHLVRLMQHGGECPLQNMEE